MVSKMSEEELLTELRSGAINFDDRAKKLIHSYTKQRELALLERLENSETRYFPNEEKGIPLSATETARKKWSK